MLPVTATHQFIILKQCGGSVRGHCPDPETTLYTLDKEPQFKLLIIGGLKMCIFPRTIPANLYWQLWSCTIHLATCFNPEAHLRIPENKWRAYWL